MAPISLTAESAQEFKTKMLGLKPHDSATKSSLKLFIDGTVGLGPWMDPVPPAIREDYQHATRISILTFRKTAANFRKWQINHQSVRIGVWPHPSACMHLWYQKRRALDLERWQQAGIADAIDLSFQLQSTGANRAPMMAATCFWDTASNTFNFRFGQMGITLLDLYAITGLPVSDKPYQEIDFEKEAVAFEADPNRRNFCKSYESWSDHYIAQSGEASGIAFLELWLTKFIVCTSTQKITDAWVRAATLLFNGHKLGLAQMTLAMLYRALYELSLHPFNYSAISGPFWILDLWLQIYFVQFRNPQITDFPENQVLGMAFAGVKAHDPLDYSECFQHLYTLDASALDASELMLNQIYPEALANKFMWGTRHSLEALHLFEQAISIADLRLPDDVGFELYAPNHFARQLGFQQEIPFPLFESVNMYTSWRLRKKGKKQTDDPRFQSSLTRCKVKIRSISLLFTSKEVSQNYDAWWSMICGDFWTMDPLYLFRIIFVNGQTLLPPQDQALLAEGVFVNHVPELASTADQAPVQDDEDDERAPETCQPSTAQTPQKRRRERSSSLEDEPEVPSVRRRRNATLTDEDVTVLERDPEEDDHMTLNEMLHNILPICQATPIAMMDTSGNRVPLDPVEETDRTSGIETSNVRETTDVAQQQSETVVDEGGTLTMLANASPLRYDTALLVPTTTPSPVEPDEPRAIVAVTETDMAEGLAPQATEEIDLETTDVDAVAEVTSEREETAPANNEFPNTNCSDPPIVSSPQMSMEAALISALEMPTLAPEVVAAKDLLSNLEHIDLSDEGCTSQISKAIAILRTCANASEIKHLNDLEFRLDRIPDLQDSLQLKEQIASECHHKQANLEERFRSEKDQLGSQHGCILSGIDAEIKSLEQLRAEIETRIAAAKQRKSQHIQTVKTKIPELQQLKEETLAAARATKQAKDDTEASRTELKRTLLDIHLLGKLV